MTYQNNNPQQNNQDRQDARAPYNFVPLPERAIRADEQPGMQGIDNVLPSHNVFRDDRLHGYFDVMLTTESPLYIRGPLTRKEAEDKEAHRNKPDFFHTGDPNSPVIPGSSLRGMLRSLLEVVTWSKLTRVSDNPKIFYRAVAAKADDPLGDDYKHVTGALGKNIRAGYLEREGEHWFIHPAISYRNNAFIKVKALKVNGQIHDDVQAVRGLIPLNSSSYRVQYHQVVTSGDFRPLKPSGFAVAVRSLNAGEVRSGVLVCTGNMAESGGKTGQVRTNRRNFVLVLENDPNVRRLQIAPQAVTDYRDGLTPFQQEPPFDENYGCLVEGRPVFYIPPASGQAVQYFGHAPFSRIPATIREGKNSRAVTPYDFVPMELREQATHIDLAEAIFGYVRSAEIIKLLGDVPQGDSQRAYASRVNVTDARLMTQTTDLYEMEITPPILGSPKPTTFQHYLEQPQGSATAKPDLHHYDSKDAQGKPLTSIRGHKLYWRQRMTSELYRKSHVADAKPDSKQHTRLKAIKPRLQFQFRVSFENLTQIEVGALAWVLALGSDNHHPNARHMLGMGKPFGMGVVKFDAALVLRDREQRYKSLFGESSWCSGDELVEQETAIEAFTSFMTSVLGDNFISHPRVQELLTLLEERAPNPLFTYMTIEPNQFKDRPVLLYPTEVVPSEEMIQKQLEEKRRKEEEQRQAEDRERMRQEAEQRKADKLRQGIQVGDVVRGTVVNAPTDASEDVEFTVDKVNDGRRYMGYVLAAHRQGGTYTKGQPVTAFVLEVEPADDGTIYLWCRRATKEERQK
jgi:CRISPR-associated protein (TIGR03986 family)